MFGGPSGKMKAASQTHFSTVPASHMPRSAFDRSHTIKTTGQCGYLIPFFVDADILPGDTIKFQSTIFARLLTPIAPAMDNLEVKTEYFFVPDRLVWTNFVKMMGEQTNPGDSISYTTPQMSGGAGASFTTGTLQDYMIGGDPTKNYGGTAGNCSGLPFRAYNKIWNDWYRDENVMNSVTVDTGDGPDNTVNYVLLQRAKKHDYFYGALTSVQKGTAVPLLTGTATVKRNSNAAAWEAFIAGGNTPNASQTAIGTTAGSLLISTPGASGTSLDPAGGLYADFTTDAIDTINTLRLAATTQQFLEKDARAGTRYTEICLSHFGVTNPDARLQRSEYLGGGKSPINTAPIPATAFTSGASHTGDLGGVTTGMGQGHGFTKSFTEHGTLIGLVTVRVAALTYQQGIQKFWKRKTRYDRYFPVFAHLGEQAITNDEIYYQGDAGGANNDAGTWAYAERWSEYRYFPNRVTGLFRSTAPSSLDVWHYAQKYGSLPSFNSTFLPDDSATVVDRNLQVTHSATVHQFKLDIYNKYHHARVMPVRSVPGIGRL